MKKFDLIIVGGGASGMMASYVASTFKNKNILLIEKNEKLGKKLFITGKGRCNVTSSMDISDFFDSITRNPEFLYSTLYSFDNKDLMNFFTTRGVPLKEERGKRVFPKSDKSSDIIKAFEKSISDININLNEEVLDISKEISYFKVKTSKGAYYSEKIIISTGGLSYPGTGSTGDGYKFAKNFGHTIVNPEASLCPILLNDEDVSLVTGLTVKNVELTVYLDNKKLITNFGDFLFTHRGISGPLVLTISDYLSGIDPSKVKIKCNFKPAIPLKELEERVLKDINSNPRRELKTLFGDYFPKSLGEYLIKKLNYPEDLKLHDINKKMRKEIIEIMTDYEFDFKSLDHIRQGIITKGGVSTLEIDPKTMESKIVPNLYFCGELIDVSALTGGFNLQIAFSTGYAAGLYAITN